MKKVAFIAMRYGKEINGGAELHCRMIAERMVRHWQVDVLTTCAVDYVRWKNELPPGQESIKEVNVIRFPVSRERIPTLFNLVYDILARRVKWEHLKKSSVKQHFTDHIKAAIRFLYCIIFGHFFLGRLIEKIWMWLQGPSSRELKEFIKQNKNKYDGFVFFTNTYATTYENLSLVADKAIVVPAAHDEPCLYFSLFDKQTQRVKAFIYNTPEEKVLFESRFPKASTIQNRVSGVGVEEREPGSGARFREKYGISGDYVVYVGRIEASKGCLILFDHFLRFVRDHNSDLKLILLGKSSLEIPDDPHIVSLGFVSEEDKFDGIAGAVCLIMPSPYESLSIVLLEAWMSNIPVIVNGACEVLKGQCERSKGGLAYANFLDFNHVLLKMLNDRTAAYRMAVSGREFTKKTYVWSKIEEDYLDVLESIANPVS